MSLLNELKRRNVFRVGIAYIVASWLLAQIADLVLDVIGAPDLVLRSLVALLALGFIPALIFAWVFEMTPEGLKRESEVNRSDSITRHTAKKLDLVTIGLLITAIALVLFDRVLPLPERPGDDPKPGSAAIDEPGAKEGEIADLPALTASESGAAAPGTEQKSIAVLPFANRSNQDDDLFFTDGIHDDLLTQLAKIHDLKVISRTSVMEYRGTTKNLRDIGTELGVATILEGGIQKVGDRVRINTQLIDVATDRHLWAETYDRELTAENIFDIQSEIAREIVRAVSIELSPEEQRLLAEIPTQNLAAYEAYLRARELFYGANYSRDQEALARPWLEKAIALDPDFVEAIALLSQIYGQLYWRGLDTSPELLETYRATVDRALLLNPRSPSALRASANYLYRAKNDYRQSLRLLEQALAHLPGNADLHGDLGISQRRQGLWQQSIESFRKALEFDPANSFYRSLLIETMENTRDWEGILANTVALEDANPDQLDIQLNRALAQYNLSGDIGPIERVLQTMRLINTSTYADMSTRVHWLRRDPDAVIETLNSPLWASISEIDFRKRSRHYQLGRAYRMKGLDQKAREQFEAAIADRDDVWKSSLQPRVFSNMTIALSMAALGRMEEALDLAHKLTAEITYDTDSMLWGWLLTRRALIRGLAGDRDGAIEDLVAALETSSSFPITVWDLHYDPQWDALRDDPRFIELATPDIPIRRSET